MFQIYFLHSVAGRKNSILTGKIKEPIVPVASSNATCQLLKGRRGKKGEFLSASALHTDGGSGAAATNKYQDDNVADHCFAENSEGLKSPDYSDYIEESVLDVYNKSLGCPTAALRKDINLEFDEILKVSSYDEFLNRVGLQGNPEIMTILLRNAVRESVSDSRYHRNRLYGNYKEREIPGECSALDPKHQISRSAKWAKSWAEIATLNSKAIADEDFLRISLIDAQIKANKRKKNSSSQEFRKVGENGLRRGDTCAMNNNKSTLNSNENPLFTRSSLSDFDVSNKIVTTPPTGLENEWTTVSRSIKSSGLRVTAKMSKGPGIDTKNRRLKNRSQQSCGGKGQSNPVDNGFRWKPSV